MSIAFDLQEKMKEVRKTNPSFSSLVREIFAKTFPNPEIVSQTELGTAINKLANHLDDEPDLENEYHNKMHFKEAVMAMAELCKEEFKGRENFQTVFCVGLFSMLGHDLGHDGKKNDAKVGRHLETTAWLISDDFLVSSKVPDNIRDSVKQIILGTEDCLMPLNRSAYMGALKDGQVPINKALVLLANEADLAGSLMPDHGVSLGKKLAEEWNKAGIEMGKTVATWKGREGFLKFAQPASNAAKAIGLTDMVDLQLQAFDNIAQELNVKRDEVCAKLDSLGDEKSSIIFKKALGSIQESSSVLACGDLGIKRMGDRLTSFREAVPPSKKIHEMKISRKFGGH